jgi:hypothetical protein
VFTFFYGNEDLSLQSVFSQPNTPKIMDEKELKKILEYKHEGVCE